MVNFVKLEVNHTRLRVALLLLSAAALTFEINLTRLFSVVQFYHFSFLIVSLALLGYGFSGTVLAIFPGWRYCDLSLSLSWSGLGMGIAILASYLLTNWLPFDSFRIAWDTQQGIVLILHFLVLAMPFFFNGLAIGLLLAAEPGKARLTYAYNLLGSALGCLAALFAPGKLGAEGTVILCSGMAIMAGWIPNLKAELPVIPRMIMRLLACFLLLAELVDIVIRLTGGNPWPFLELQLSPYKGLSYALQAPGSEIISQRWNAYSRVDVVRSSAIRSVPGLSYRYLEPLPVQDGLFIDGDDLAPLLEPGDNLEFAAYLSSAIAYQLRPGANVLILEPRAGLDVLVARSLDARTITVVEPNNLVVKAAAPIYHLPGVQWVPETGRSYLRRTHNMFDIIQVSLTSAYHPVRSGAYSLAEDYRYTIEAFGDALKRLSPDGFLVAVRWLQNPPSESLRLFALAVEALEQNGGEPRAQLAALRGYNTLTLFVKKTPFEVAELEEIRSFAAHRAFDLAYLPGLTESESNLYNVLPESVYYQKFQALLAAQPRQEFYAAYPFDVSPPTDNKPFFSHFFKWSQSGQLAAEIGKTWQPFGGAGYFVVLGLLILAILLSGGLILLPVVFIPRATRKNEEIYSNQVPQPTTRKNQAAWLTYFLLLGLAFLFLEIPLMQHFILYLGQPAYALTVILFTLLFFSGLGSWQGRRLSPSKCLAVLVGLTATTPWLLPIIFQLTLGLPFSLRLLISILCISPLGFFMGIPLPAGLQTMAQQVEERFIPWAWGVNGAASVVSSLAAALLALTFGLTIVLWAGTACYAAAWLVFSRIAPADIKALVDQA